MLSSSGPEQTTVFWVEHSDQGYVAKLLFDSFKGKITNETTMLGAATFERENAILLKEFEEPGSGPFDHMGRVFRLDLMSGTVTPVSLGVPQEKVILFYPRTGFQIRG